MSKFEKKYIFCVEGINVIYNINIKLLANYGTILYSFPIINNINIKDVFYIYDRYKLIIVIKTFIEKL